MIKPTPENLLANLKANPHPKQTHLEMAGGYAYITVDGYKIVYDGQWWFGPTHFYDVRLNLLPLHQEIDRVLDRIKNPQDKPTVAPDTDTKELKNMTASRNATQERVEALQQLLLLFGLDINAPTDKAHVEIKRLFSRITDLESQVNGLNDEARKIQLVNDQMSDLLAERETLFAKIKGLTVENEGLKSKADRAGLLSVVCRRLCGDENASIETVHAAIDLCHDQANTIDFIGDRVGSDPDTTIPNRFSEIRSLVAQAVKSLGEKTVENAKLQEGIKNYESQLKGYAANKQLQMLDSITKILRDAEIATVYDYEDNRAIEADERVRILCERLKQKTVEWRDDAAKMHKLVDEIRQAHLTLNEMNAPRCMGTIDLSLSARIRSLFNTKV